MGLKLLGQMIQVKNLINYQNINLKKAVTFHLIYSYKGVSNLKNNFQFKKILMDYDEMKFKKG